MGGKEQTGKGNPAKGKKQTPQHKTEAHKDAGCVASAARKATSRPREALNPDEVLALQRAVGNVTVTSLLNADRADSVQRFPTDREAADIAAELRRRLRRRNTGAQLSFLDDVLLNVSREQFPQLLAVYRAYPGGSMAFIQDLGAFCERIPVHPGQDREETRDWYWDRWAARLFDAGVPEIQERYHTARAIVPSAANLEDWITEWTDHFTTGPGAGDRQRELVFWVLNNWQAVTRGNLRALVRACGFAVSAGGDLYRASYNILSSHQVAHQAGVRAGLNYFHIIASNYESSIDNLITAAQSYNESYVAANFPIWRFRRMPFHRGLDRRIVNWFQLNERQPIPLVRGDERRQIVALHRLYQEYWRRGYSPNSTLLGQAGIRIYSAGP